MSRILFYMGHPAHFHNFKHCVLRLREQGHESLIVARGKDVLFELLDDADTEVVRFPERKSVGKWGLALNVLSRERKLLRVVRKWKPDLMAGTDLGITHVGKLTGIPSVVVNEDDSHAVPLMAKYAFPYATAILAPNCCDQSPYNHKKIGYEGYHELAYLHPNYFQPDRELLPEEIRNADTYFILRFASLHAHHDRGRSGIDDRLALELIERLKPHGKVFITSERSLNSSLEPYRLPIPAALIHHSLAFARMVIGDSQTMAAEAAVLGTPSIRYNDFVGELSYLEELETKYRLTTGIRTGQPEALLSTVDRFLDDTRWKEDMEARREYMLASTADVTDIMTRTFVKLAETHR